MNRLSQYRIHAHVINKAFLMCCLLAFGMIIGCNVRRPMLLDEAGQGRAKPKLLDYLESNAPILAEEGIRTNPVNLISARQPDELYPFEQWQLTVQDTAGRNRELILKIYLNQADADSEEHNLIRARAAKLPVMADLVWGLAKPYAATSSALFTAPEGLPLARLLANRVRSGETSFTQLYDPLVDQLAKLHIVPAPTGAGDNFPAGDWLRQMAEVGTARSVWKASIRDSMLVVAKTWKPQQLGLLHGDFSEQSVYITLDKKVTALANLERMGYGDPAYDAGFLLAQILVINPMTYRFQFGIDYPANVDLHNIAAHVMQRYWERMKITPTPPYLNNLRTAFTLRLASFVLYQSNDPVMQPGAERVKGILPAILQADLVTQIAAKVIEENSKR